MMKATDKQTLLDMSLQHVGDIEKAFELARANNMSISDALVVGREYEGIDVNDVALVDYYKQKKVRPANLEATTAVQDGIGSMAIEFNFIVS